MLPRDHAEISKQSHVFCSIIDESQQALQDWWKCNIPDGAYEIADIETYLSRLAVGLNRMVRSRDSCTGHDTRACSDTMLMVYTWKVSMFVSMYVPNPRLNLAIAAC